MGESGMRKLIIVIGRLLSVARGILTEQPRFRRAKKRPFGLERFWFRGGKGDAESSARCVMCVIALKGYC